MKAIKRMLDRTRNREHRRMRPRVTALAATCVMLGSFVFATDACADKHKKVLAQHKLKTLDGEEMTLASLKGDIVVVNFWASWCPPCREELPVMNAWNNAWKDRGATVVAISIDKDAANAKRFAEKVNLSLPVFHDGPSGLAKHLDLPSLPCTYLLDANGNIVTVIQSSSKADLAALKGKVETLLASRPKPNDVGLKVAPRENVGSSSDGGTR